MCQVTKKETNKEKDEINKIFKKPYIYFENKNERRKKQQKIQYSDNRAD